MAITKPTPSWRDVLKIHPAVELFPPLDPDELRALGEDIRKYGLREPVVVMRKYRHREDGKLELREYDLVLIDGRSRLDAMEAAGFTLVRDGKLDPTLGHKALGLEPLTGGAYAEFDGVESDVKAFVASRNIHRRHLTIEQKHDLIAELLKDAPEKSDRQIAKMVKASPTFVGKVRAEKEATGDVSTVDTRRDSRGRQQPARKPPNRIRAMNHRRMKLGDETVDALKGTSLDNAAEMDALVFLNRGAPLGKHTDVVKALVADAITGKPVSAIDERLKPPPRDDVGQNSAGEIARKDARIVELENHVRRLEQEKAALERENRALRTENEELRAHLPPGDAGPIPACCRREATS